MCIHNLILRFSISNQYFLSFWCVACGSIALVAVALIDCTFCFAQKDNKVHETKGEKNFLIFKKIKKYILFFLNYFRS